MSKNIYDVAVVGAGPAGSTLGGLLKKYAPELRVVLIEREEFPRDHVGESLLPVVGQVLNELGAWEKVEAAGFPIKLGAIYKWGRTDDLWEFNFVQNERFEDRPRPGTYTGQRVRTAFQVDRAVYDKILADHAESLGCEIRYRTSVRTVKKTDDHIDALMLDSGEELVAQKYIDASGGAAFLRRAMGVGIDEPSNLRNIAIWDYWRNTEWAVRIGVGGTRIQVMSLGYGWLWFIPLGPDRTSIGFVCPAEYSKRSGKTPYELYHQALADEPDITRLIANGTCENRLATTKDWSFVAQRMYGDNWALTGEALGFADPILSAGLSITHESALEAACTILEERRGGDASWMWEAYQRRNDRRVRQHIRFADYWYTANAHFGELKEFTREIARDAGLDLDAEAAFQWLGTGGFVDESIETGGMATFSMQGVQQLINFFAERPVDHAMTHGKNHFVLDATGAVTVRSAQYVAGRVYEVPMMQRGSKVAPLNGFFGMVVEALSKSPHYDDIVCSLEGILVKSGLRWNTETSIALHNCLEALVRDGWVRAEKVDGERVANFDPPATATGISYR